MMPDASIVIPAYQSRAWIRTAVDSALSQEGVACEVIVVDDGSTDGTAELLEACYGGAVRVVRQANRGLAAARNRGLAGARGEFVQFLDADDALCPGKVAAQVQRLCERSEYDVAYCDFAWADAETMAPVESSGCDRLYASGDLMLPLLRRNLIVCHAALARTAMVRAVGGFDEQLRACEDYDLWLRLAARGVRFLHTPGVGVLYRRTPGSMSADRSRQFAGGVQVLEKIGPSLRPGPARAAWRRHLAGLHSMLARIHAAEAWSGASRLDLGLAGRHAARAARAAGRAALVLAGGRGVGR